MSKLKLGINLAGIADYSTEQPFLNRVKNARNWITQRDGEWDTGTWANLTTDVNGYPTSLASIGGVNPRVVIFINTGQQTVLPPEKYVITWDGTGDVRVGFDFARINAESSANRIVVNYNPTIDEGGIIEIRNPGTFPNHVRNLKCYRLADEPLVQQGQVFNPVFLEKMARFDTLRFMDWGGTNHSPVSTWASRGLVDNYSYAWAGKGVPIEVMAQLCNELKANMWYCVPHRATDEYVTNAVATIKGILKPELKLYLEYSNETWNGDFSQYQYLEGLANARWTGAGDGKWQQMYGVRAAEIMRMARTVYTSSPDKLVRVFGVQTGWFGLEDYGLDAPLFVAENPGTNRPPREFFDVLAMTGYFTGKMNDGGANETVVHQWADTNNLTAAFTQMRNGSALTFNGDNLATGLEAFNFFKGKATAKLGASGGVVVYEGGQHLVPYNDPKRQTLYRTMQRDVRMGNLYYDTFNNWKNSGNDLFCIYNNVSAIGNFGAWGLLEHVGQSPAAAPKYQRTMDWLNDNPTAENLRRLAAIVPPRDLSNITAFVSGLSSGQSATVSISNTNLPVNVQNATLPVNVQNQSILVVPSTAPLRERIVENTELTGTDKRIQLTVPANRIWEPILISARITTTLTTGNRVVTVRYIDTQGRAFLAAVGTNIAANANGVVQTLGNVGAAGGGNNILPAGAFLQPGEQIAILFTTGIDAADTCIYYFQYKEYIV